MPRKRRPPRRARAPGTATATRRWTVCATVATTAMSVSIPSCAGPTASAVWNRNNACICHSRRALRGVVPVHQVQDGVLRRRLRLPLHVLLQLPSAHVHRTRPVQPLPRRLVRRQLPASLCVMCCSVMLVELAQTTAGRTACPGRVCRRARAGRASLAMAAPTARRHSAAARTARPVHALGSTSAARVWATGQGRTVTCLSHAVAIACKRRARWTACRAPPASLDTTVPTVTAAVGACPTRARPSCLCRCVRGGVPGTNALRRGRMQQVQHGLLWSRLPAFDHPCHLHPIHPSSDST